MRPELLRAGRAILGLALGFATALASLMVLFGLLICVMLVFTLPLLPLVVRVQRWLVAVDRRRVAARTGKPVEERYAEVSGHLLHQVVTVLTDPATRRDLRWLLVHAPAGMLLGILGFAVPVSVPQNLVVPMVWWLVPGGLDSSYGIHVDSWPAAGLSVLSALAAALVSWWLPPRLADWEAGWASRLLSPGRASLAQRVAELTATRAAALEAHGAELRRIERDLHDGTQNRLVAVVMHLGIVERALRRDPPTALASVLTAQNAATDALIELREVVRSIYPPVLADRGLDGAVDAVVARCPIPATLTVTGLRRLPAAVEAAAYFVIAEALTNVAKHSGAEHAEVSLAVQGDHLVIEVRDDGHGGAEEANGTGLTGIRRRVAAFDGQTTLSSPEGGPTVLGVRLPTGT
ncbi:sensor histidine kinase [Crossiella sp. CA-258035]|uniref:sensor histidine kinase n=1 Tax=Crossiella sp. CA-258035 TaxID=2981138 RepID=UPI0024BC46AD|nr:sensor histidine kinase [Crossiella sp. CA-258035]WHT16728.1 sensor histidine kinase [Crossiella sp. CA-258035]